MGLASALIGLIPSYASIGIAAPLLLVLLRMAQGFGAGAEQAGAAVMMTESAPRKRRGYYAALPFLGIQLGTVTAGIIYYVMLTGVPDITQTMLWRVPFIGSALLLVIALYMRLRLKESPTFEQIENDERREEVMSIRETLTASWRPILAGLGLRMAENGGSSIYQVLAISYLVHTIGMSSRWGTLVLIGAAVVGGITIPVAGLLSDRFGRVRVYRGFAILQAVSALPVWYVFSQGDPLNSAIALSFALGVATWGMFGTQGAFLPRCLAFATAIQQSPSRGNFHPSLREECLQWLDSSLLQCSHGSISAESVAANMPGFRLPVTSCFWLASRSWLLSTFPKPEDVIFWPRRTRCSALLSVLQLRPVVPDHLLS